MAVSSKLIAIGEGTAMRTRVAGGALGLLGLGLLAMNLVAG